MSLLWQSVSPKSLVELAEYQWKEYGTKIDIITTEREDIDSFFDEELEYIDKFIRQPPSRSRGTE